jgi:septal ring factor EnvC (AmiA/AmiB activator)
MGSRPQSHLKRNHDSSNSDTNSNTSYSSLPETDENYYENSDAIANANGSSDYDNKYKKRSSNNSMPLQSFLVWRVLPCLMMILLPWIPNQFVRNQVRSTKLAIDNIIREQKDMVENLDETTGKIKQLKQEVENLHKDNELSFQELKQNGKTPENLAAGDETVEGTSKITDMKSEEYAKMEEEEEVLVNRIDRLEKNIQQSAVKRLGDR